MRPMDELGDSAWDAPATYDRMLAQWERFARRGIHSTASGSWYFGDPGHGEDGIRSAANFVFASASLARRGSEQSLEWVQRELRYLCRSHLSGDARCADGASWGRQWQSSWWSAKLGLGAHLVWSELGRDLRERVIATLADEADHLLTRIPATGLAWDTKAEENAWDTEALAVALLLAPGHAHAPRWREQLDWFAINSLSRAVDRESAEVVCGRPLRDWITSVNLFHDFTLENHGSSHFCYVASPLDSLTWSRAAFQLAGAPVPDSLRHNVAQFWARHKSLFLDDRFAHVGGQDWARYTYGQYFIVPVCVALQQTLRDPSARTIERARVRRLAQEQALNGDGAFFSRRVTHGILRGQPLKYETDCFAHLALARLLHELERPAVAARTVRDLHVVEATAHVALETQVAWVRTGDMFSSFCAQTLDTHRPLVLFSASGGDDLTEWMPGNLCGAFECGGLSSCPRVVAIARSDDGSVQVEASLLYRQGARGAVSQQLSVRIDPRAQRLTIRSAAVALRRMWVREAFGLNLAVANDVFNDARRLYRTPACPGGLAVEACPRRRDLSDKVFKRLRYAPSFRRRRVELGSESVTIDDLVRVRTPGQKLWVLQSPENDASNSLRYDVVGAGPHRVNFYARADETLFAYEAELTLATEPGAP